MAVEYSTEVCTILEQKFRLACLHRPMRVRRYDAGAELVYDVKGIEKANDAQVRFVVERFIGGGFAGQVYKVKVLDIKTENGHIPALQLGGVYAMKILVPPATFATLFRNFLYWIGFQGPFQLQVNPAAARAGALWQKFIRRGVKLRFGDEKNVVDIYATFVDNTLGSCGELSEWVDGRTWQLEVDDHIDLLKKWSRGRSVDETLLGSPEYRAKKQFMADFVRLLHDMGAYELARQYEWWTAKSQPNCLKRKSDEDNPSAGLVAVDFRAGLVLLPFLPMSPGDFKLIIDGFNRSSLVQFDRGDVDKLQAFIQAHPDEFDDTRQMLTELKEADLLYRDSVPDIAHNHIRLFRSRQLWQTILASAITGWKVRNIIDDPAEKKLRSSSVLTLFFFMIGLIPFLGTVIRRIWARKDWRNHYKSMLSGWDYLCRALWARIDEKLIDWYRTGRIDRIGVTKLTAGLERFLLHLPLSVLPAGLHRFLTDFEYAKQRLAYFIVRPVRLYFNADLREQWLRQLVTEGQNKYILTNEDAQTILSQLNEPFIQKYLKSLAVHLCTLPLSELVSIIIIVGYVLLHPEMPRAQAWGIGLGIVALLQVMPISPGALVRGLYVLYLIIRERNFKDYNIAVFLSFLKGIGYLAFPIQMTYHYPVLARFMAAHWATDAAHIVPVFGERGALLEHWVFCLAYNWPLTIRRRMQRRSRRRASIKPRYWHVGLCAVVAAVAFGIADFAYTSYLGQPPALKNIWWLVVLIPFLCGGAVTAGCGGAPLKKRIVASTACGILAGLLYTAASAMLIHNIALTAAGIVTVCLWRIFIFAILSTIAAIITELKLPEPPSD